MSIKVSKPSDNGWSVAISDAEKRIQEAQAKIRALKKSIATFRRLRDCGEPFPARRKTMLPNNYSVCPKIRSREAIFRQSHPNRSI
jgi:hypothetical protein